MGRTGVFCGISMMIERLKAEGVIDVFQTVQAMRLQRPAMVQTAVRNENVKLLKWRASERTNKRTKTQTNEGANVWTNRRTNEWTNEDTNEGASVRTYERTNERTKAGRLKYLFPLLTFSFSLFFPLRSNMNSATQRYKSTWIRLIYMQTSSKGLVNQ